ncbi:MAG: hypothetical protein LBD18_00985 [Treponema sp.]|nr:hypothetical protein [Treponema sp.]
MAVSKAQILDEIKWFNEQLVYLRDTFITWIKEGGHEVDVLEEKINNKEELSGTYSTFKYIMTIDKSIKIILVPYGIWIVAARGRIDISGPSGIEKLIYLYKDGPVSTTEIKSGSFSEKTARHLFNNIDEEGWYWYDDSIIRKMIKISKETFEYLIGRIQ